MWVTLVIDITGFGRCDFPVDGIRHCTEPHSSVGSAADLRTGGHWFDPKHVRKVVFGFGKKSCVSTGVRKPRNTYASSTAMI